MPPRRLLNLEARQSHTLMLYPSLPIRLAALLPAFLPTLLPAQTNHALGQPVTASSFHNASTYPAEYAVDGDLSDASRWLGAASETGNTLTVDLAGPTELRQVHVYSGYQNQDVSPIDLFSFEWWDGAAWQPIAGTTVAGDNYFATTYNFAAAVTTAKLRMVIADTDVNRLRDLTLWTTPTNLYTGTSGSNRPLWVERGFVNHALGKPVAGSSFAAPDEPRFAVDGVISDSSRWTSEVGPGESLEIDLGTSTELREAHVYNAIDPASTGAAPTTSNFHLESWNGTGWVAVPGSNVSLSEDENHKLTFTNPVTTSRIRIINDSGSSGDPGHLRIREVALWSESLPLFVGMTGPGIVDPTSTLPALTPIVSLNQIGYQTTAPKRFTAPVAADGTGFTVTPAAEPATVLFSGTIEGGHGDFSAFRPNSGGLYIVSYLTTGGLRISSYPFLIEDDLIEEKLVKPAIDFMIDSRSGVGTHPSAYGGAPWRDGTYYSFEAPSLIYLHLNARAASNQKVGQIDFAAEKATVLDPSFDSTYVAISNAGDFLTELRRFYQDAEAPLPGCPDALATVHFGLGLTMAQLDGTKDPSGDPLPKHLHSQTREWFAWFLYAWPALRDHLPDSFYAACRDFTFANWATSSGLDDSFVSNNRPSPLDIDPLWAPSSYGGHDKHPFKGRHPPGHSILPNLLLWQVALREGRGDADVYLAAAQAQTQWVIDNLNWSDPRTTKGHRMSEHKMMPGLVHFLRNHPDQAPPGLAAKIEEWADVMIARSDNLWDFRRYELTDTDGDGVVDWTLPKQSFNWNEPGNLAGFPACALSAAWTLGHAPEKQQRLREMAQSAIDCLFGRNPLNTGSASRPHLGFPDQETAWTPAYSGAAAYLENVRGALASGPGSEHFPYNPEAQKRWNEGWVNFNAAFNMGLSYMLADQSPDPEPLAAAFPLVISEILAEPAGDPLAGFIELHNPSSEQVRLTGLTLAGDVAFTVPPETAPLAPGARCLIVRDLAAFESTHGGGLPVIGTFTGELEEAGGPLELGDVNGNSFLTVDRASLPQFSGHSLTNGLSGWRISADENGSPGGSDSIPFAGDASGDSDHDGVPDLVHHAVAGTDRAYVAPQIDLAGPGVTVRVTRNLAADDTRLMLEWCDDLTNWQDAGAPLTILPSGDRLAEWTFQWLEPPSPFFIRLKAIR